MSAVRASAVHHVGLAVADIDAAAAWFARVFGLERLTDWSIGDMRLTLLGAGSVRVELFAQPGAAPGPDESIPVMEHFARRGWKHLALTVADVDAAVERLRGEGVEIIADPALSDAGFRYAFLRGPDGVPIELVEG